MIEDKKDAEPPAAGRRVEPLVGRRLSFLKAFKLEIASWKRLTIEQESMLRMFSACVAMRMRGEDPKNLLMEKPCDC
jgi:hypothetical protein